MGQLFREGETRIRPGISYRYSNRGQDLTPGAIDGINAFVMNAQWGPVGEVVALTSAKSVKDTFGESASVDAAMAIFAGGANTVYAYRPAGKDFVGDGGAVIVRTGAAGTVMLDNKLTVSAKYPGDYSLQVVVRSKAWDPLKKELLISVGTLVKETHIIDVGGDEVNKFCEAINKSSNYVTAAPVMHIPGEGEAPEEEGSNGNGDLPEGAEIANGAVGDCTGTLEGGVTPILTADDYKDGFEALAPYQYGFLSVDSVDSNVVGTLKEYVDEANAGGKLIVGVTGSNPEAGDSMDDRCTAARKLDSAAMVYLGNGYVDGNDNSIEGVQAIAYTAGMISAAPSSQSIVHTVIPGAVDLTERLTNAQYEKGILNGVLLLSVSPDGQVWYDSGVNTLITPSPLQDDGWKKIKRVKVRNELLDRMDRCLAKKIGKVSCDTDGIADVLQGGIGVMNEMIGEHKLRQGSTMYLDPDAPPQADSVWFVIDADDIDSLEKLYLHYQFRYSQNV